MRFATRAALFVIVVSSTIAGSRSVWDGVYSKEQAGRGQKAYNSLCARCHGEALLGGENSPPLVDQDFLDKWNGKSVGSLVEFTRKTMPSDGPGKLSRRQCADLIAYLLSANAFPAGEKDLESDAAVLNEILIQPKP
jgi:mono/diheme cytochrome c family protein